MEGAGRSRLIDASYCGKISNKSEKTKFRTRKTENILRQTKRLQYIGNVRQLKHVLLHFVLANAKGVYIYSGAKWNMKAQWKCCGN